MPLLVADSVAHRAISTLRRVTDLSVDPRGVTVEIDFEIFVDRLHAVGMQASRVRQIADFGGAPPRLRPQIILVVQSPAKGTYCSMCQSIRHQQWHSGLPQIDLTCRPCPRCPRRYKIGFLSFWIGPKRHYKIGEIVARIPASLDRSDRFFTNFERTVQQSQLPALSADSRNFFTTTSSQIEQIRSELDGLIGTNGELVKFSEEARASIKAADLPAATQSARDAADNSRLASDDLRRSLPAIRDSFEQLRELARQLEEQPESVVYGRRPPQEKH